MTDRIGFNRILEDNEEHYYRLLDATISSIDHLSNTTIVKKPSSVSIRIAPSSPSFSQSILQEILSLHNLLGVKLILSKSMRTSSVLNFSVPIFA
jgi:hypothetical protein